MSTVHTPANSATPPLDARLHAIQTWLTTPSMAEFGLNLASLRPASKDASFRRYFRLDSETHGSLIVMDAAPPQENVTKFVKLAQLFSLCKLSVPQIFAQELEQGFLLLADFGETSYLHQLNADTAHRLYLDAIDALILLQVHSRPDVLPEYDRPFLLRELQLFPEWFIGKHLQFSLNEKQQKDLDKVFDVILANNMAQAQVFVHRDFHSRNLMVLQNGNPGILDFQDAVFGPITYDLASLLRDAYVQWDEEMVLDWVIRYWEKAKRANLPVNPDIDAFYRDFEFMGLQRHLKILGIFCRLNYRDGKNMYLHDLPLVLEYVRKTANRYTDLKPLLRLMDVLENKQVQVGYTF
ncbi:MAG: phosphotransferase [Burkholderiales bacterium]|nr:phosphotransferase [Burkholderiales bacterium]